MVVLVVRLCARHSVPSCFSEPNVAAAFVCSSTRLKWLGRIRRRREHLEFGTPSSDCCRRLLSRARSSTQISFPVVFSVQGDGEGAEEATWLEDGAGFLCKCDAAGHEEQNPVSEGQENCTAARCIDLCRSTWRFNCEAKPLHFC